MGNSYSSDDFDPSKLDRVDTKRAAHLVPGDYIVPLGGEAEKTLASNGGVPIRDETVKVIRKPHPSIASKRDKPLVAMKVQCMNGKKLYMRTPPAHKFAVFG
ncbi:hypothetical protein [Candidatus Poriferisocius sp.]|uniref:hypothetical protein n=1 Tax=Candidatus Poriferisocius sp. TaxID=3101276 RepID=UPI003B0110B5